MVWDGLDSVILTKARSQRGRAEMREAKVTNRRGIPVLGVKQAAGTEGS